MPARKGQPRISQTPTRAARGKRARPQSRDMSNEPAQSPMSLGDEYDPPAEGSLPLMPWDETVEMVKSEPMSMQIKRYKDWKQNGSKHETICRVCLKGASLAELDPCHTCRLVFHLNCVPQARGVRTDKLYCAVCVDRGWHRNPPVLTPPASPRVTTVDSPDVATPNEPARSAARPMSISDLVSGTESAETVDPLQRIMRDYPASLNHVKGFDSRVLDSLPVSTTSPRLPHASLPEAHQTPPTEVPPPKRQRKSKFATLSNEIEASLSVLYRELESVTSLKLQIDELQKQNSLHAQQTKLRDNEIALLRRDIAKRRADDGELAQLRTIVSQRFSVQDEVAQLRAKNAALQSDLDKSRAETAEARELVNTWKGKLTQLLDA
ncbi:hypothetical protein BJX64DRAFT_142041 [Aspergillus heterothallicus]